MADFWLTEALGSENLSREVHNRMIRAINTLGLCYVTETGTSGAWYWRKWSDGRVDAWMRVNASVTTDIPSGSGWRSTNTPYSFPVQFAEPPMVTCSPVSGSNTLWASLNSVTATSMGLYFMSFDQKTHTGAACNVHVSGRVS